MARLGQNRTILIIALIAVVNALGYGIIIPILYSYSRKFGLSDFQNGLLFSTFAVCQFLSTPLIGRLSDKYGRKPLLVISIAGTAISFFLSAFAPSAIFLFLARALDGLTAGNIPVASAVISDSTEPKDRAKGFGIIGASFGFGFVFGPTISALTVGLGQSVPFIIAGVVASIAAILTALYLPETNAHIGQVSHGKLFDLVRLTSALTDENVGSTLLVSLLYAIAFSLFIFAFQPFAVKVLRLGSQQIAATFTLFGLVGLISQIVLIPRVVKVIGDTRALTGSLVIVTGTFFLMFLVRSFFLFLGIAVIHGLASSFIMPLIQTLLSKETDDKSQGSIQGLNASYLSVGQIVGPILGGVLSSIILSLPFFAGSVMAAFCFLISLTILRKKTELHAWVRG